MCRDRTCRRLNIRFAPVALAAAVCGCWAAFYDFAMAVEAQLSFRIVQVPQCTLRPGANRHRKVGASSLSE